MLRLVSRGRSLGAGRAMVLGGRSSVASCGGMVTPSVSACAVRSCPSSPSSVRPPPAAVARSFASLALSVREKAVLKVLQGLRRAPDDAEDIVFSGHVRSVSERDGHVSVVLPLDDAYRELKRTITERLTPATNTQAPDWVRSVRVVMETAAPTPANAPATGAAAKEDGLTRVRHIIAVSSGKGGVGKSTVSVNLAYALSRLQVDADPSALAPTRELRVGILDADVYGPSLPTMVSPRDAVLRLNASKRIVPPVYEGVKLMSYGFVSAGQKAPEKLGPAEGKDPAAAAQAAVTSGAFIRGPLASAAVRQMAVETEWGELDYLVVDLPPGTGDIQLTLTQLLRFSGAMVVTTPQKLALVDVAKGLELFRKTHVPVLGVVANMAYFVCGKCDEKHRIFGGGGDQLFKRLRQEYAVDHLVEVPIHTQLSEAGDSGDPFVLGTSIAEDTQGVRAAYDSMAKLVHDQIAVKDAAAKSSATAQTIPSLTFDATTGMLTLNEPTATAPSTAASPTAAASPLRISALSLRLACQCAGCVDELSGRPRLVPSKVPHTVVPRAITPRGNYAAAVHWSDGHTSSVYPFDAVRQLIASQRAGKHQ